MNVPLRLGALLLVVLMIQLTVFVDVRFLGVAPELLALVAIIGAFYVGPERGPVLAFGAGVVWDVYLPTPLGITAITLAVAASCSYASPLSRPPAIHTTGASKPSSALCAALALVAFESST